VYVVAALRGAAGNKAKAAQVIGLRDRQGIYPILKRLAVTDDDIIALS
jgi:hypothetical protein